MLNTFQLWILIYDVEVKWVLEHRVVLASELELLKLFIECPVNKIVIKINMKSQRH